MVVARQRLKLIVYDAEQEVIVEWREVNPPGELPKEVTLITFDVILLQQVDNGYSARPVLWPDSVAHGATEQEALDRVRTLIRDLLSRTRFVQVELDVSKHQLGVSSIISGVTPL